MTLAERARMATEVRRAKAAVRADILRQRIANGENYKRAMHYVGVSRRTAGRYTAKASG